MRTIDGIPVINASSDWPLVITEKHAKEGIPMDVEKCPGALACLDNIPGAKRAKVFKSVIDVLKDMYINDEKVERWEKYNVPKSLMVQEAIIDNGGHFTPGVYLLKAPTKSRRTGTQQGSDTRPPKGEREPRRVYHKTPMRVNAPTQST